MSDDYYMYEPCPFCGADGEALSYEDTYGCYCLSCGCEGNLSNNPVEVIMEWNALREAYERQNWMPIHTAQTDYDSNDESPRVLIADDHRIIAAFYGINDDSSCGWVRYFSDEEEKYIFYNHNFTHWRRAPLLPGKTE
jgi:hypothetical protein